MEFNLKTFKQIIAAGDIRQFNEQDVFVLLSKAKEEYYTSSNVIIPNDVYDAVADMYENEYGLLPVGYTPEGSSNKRLVDTKHEFTDLLGTLSKQKTLDDLLNSKLTSVEFPASFIVSHKYDGNSVALTFAPNGEVVKAVTRGDDGQGVDLTDVFSHISVDSSVFDGIEDNIHVKCEVMITYQGLEALSEEKNITYANPRSCVSGRLHSSDAATTSKYFVLAPLDISVDSGLTRLENIDVLTKISESSKYFLPFVHEVFLVESLDDFNKQIKSIYNLTNSNRGSLDYMIDGLVIELSDETVRKSMGWTSGSPNYATALKLPSFEKETILRDIIFDYGIATSRITPKAVFDTVTVNGAKCNTVSLASLKRYKELLPLKVGQPMIFTYVNDTLGYIDKLNTTETIDGEDLSFITSCPKCGSDLVENESGALIYCGNSQCIGRKVGDVVIWLQRLGIKGIGEKTIERLFDSGVISQVQDIYSVTEEQLKTVPSFGQKSIDNFLKLVHSVKEVTTDKFLHALCIEQIGSDLSSIIANNFDYFQIINIYDDLDESLSHDDRISIVIKTIKNQLTRLESVELKTVQLLVDGIIRRADFICELPEDFIVSEPEQIEQDDVSYTLCITGTLNKLKRADLVNLLKSRGHKVTSKVTSNTDFLVNNDVESTSSKNKDAKKLGKEIITEDQLYSKLNISV